MRVVDSQSRDAVEYLFNGRKGKLVSIQEWTRAVFGHGTPTLQKKMVKNISRYREFAESRGFGMLCSIHEEHGNLSRVTHVLLADEHANPKYIARELMARKGRQLGFHRSFNRGLEIVLSEKLLPAARVEEIQERKARPAFLPLGERQKYLEETTERLTKKNKPQYGQAVKIAAASKH